LIPSAVANFASAFKYQCFKNCLMFNLCSSVVKKKSMLWLVCLFEFSLNSELFCSVKQSRIFFVWTKCCMLCVCHNTTTQKLFCCMSFVRLGHRKG